MTDNIRYFSDAVQEQRRIKCFMDGIEWQHHLGNDALGTKLFPSVEATRQGEACLRMGGKCGIVEVEVRLIRWVEPQDLEAESVQGGVRTTSGPDEAS